MLTEESDWISSSQPPSPQSSASPEKQRFVDPVLKDDASTITFTDSSIKKRGSQSMKTIFRVLSSFDKYLTDFCVWLAGLVVRYKAIFVLVPFFVAIILAHGLRTIEFSVDNDFLFTPIGSRALTDREKVEAHFPTNFSAFVPGHETRVSKMLEILLSTKTAENVLNPAVWQEADELNQFLVKKLVVTRGERKIRFEDVCARFNGQCLQNGFLALSPNIQNILDGKLKLTYPLMQDPVNFNSFMLPAHLGGLTVVTNENPETNATTYEVESARSLRLFYVLDCSNEQKTELASVWQTGALQVLQSNITMNLMTIDAVNSDSIPKELVNNIHTAIQYIHYAIGFVIAYTVANTYHPVDGSKIKVWVGLLGLINTAISTAGAWGLLCYCGYNWQAINLASVFLLLGVGLDDTFVVLSAWRHTDSKESVEERMKECYKEAAVSITITSLTNILSFFVGAIFPGFNCVQLFCLYTGVGIVFIYFYNLTFFGGCLAIAGELEKRDFHGLLLLPRKKVERWSVTDPAATLEGPITISEYFFEDLLPNLLVKKSVKGIIIIIFAVYLALSIFWVSRTREGFERRKLALDDSFVVSYYNKEDADFRLNPFRYQIVITDPIDYSDKEVRQSVLDLMQRFKGSRFVSSNPEFEESWLNEFLKSMRKKSEILQISEDELLSKENFMRELNEFLGYAAATPLVHNLVLSADKSSILASRFFLQSSKSADANDDMALVKEIRLIADSANFSVAVFNPFFTYIDLFIGVMPSTVSCLVAGTVIMLFVAFVLIPNPLASVWVIFTIISIEVGVLGFMFVWNINLDVISMICLIMCIGFSVDFSAHISYHFLAAEGQDSDQRIRSSLKAFGTPIIQGATSTLLAVAVLAFLPSYILQSFAKMLFLVIILGVVHGLFLLPVLLSLFWTCSCCSKTDKISEQNNEPRIVSFKSSH